MIRNNGKVTPDTATTRRHRSKGANQGFTFIEVIVSLALMATLVAIVGMGLVAAMQSFSFSRANVEVLQKGQMAMARMARELTELDAIHGVDGEGHFIVYDRVVQSSDGTSAMVTYCLQFDTNSKQVLLFTDIASDTTAPPETGGNLLIDEVDNLTFRFFQGEDDWTMASSDITLLSTIQIELDLIRPDAPDRTHKFTTLVHLRNTGNLGGAV